jgi:hypothetical protein
MPMNSVPPMTSVDRIRKMSQKGYDIGGSVPRPAPVPSPYGQPSGSLNDSIQQDFNDSMTPRPAPMLPPDGVLNAPVQWERNPITGKQYMPSQNIRG